LREVFRKLAQSGKTGVLTVVPQKRTWIELAFEEWARENNYSITSQYQISKYEHHYDYRIDFTKVIVELDGDYWHDFPGIQLRDYTQEQQAMLLGYQVARFTEKQIKKTKGKCFDSLHFLIDNYNEFKPRYHEGKRRGTRNSFEGARGN
jgi:very-short-patch-repair endonuclease